MTGKVIKAPAKINITLNIGEKVADLHPIKAIFLKIDLYDEIEVAEEGDGLKLNSETFYEQNTVVKSYNILKEAGYNPGGLKVSINKNIPPGGGLGGGSSNAGAILNAMNEMCNLNISKDKLLEYGLMVGSDVPFFIVNRNAYVSHFGEVITPIEVGEMPDILVTFTDRGCNTRDVYNKFDKIGRKNRDKSNFSWNRFIYSIEVGDIDTIEAMMFNDLEPVVLEEREDIRTAKEIMNRHGLRCVMMSGSGCSVFGFSNNRDIIADTEDELKSKGYKIHIGRIIA